MSNAIVMSGSILGYVKNGQMTKAVRLFHEIRYPNGIILTILFNASAKNESNEAVELLKKIWSTMPSPCLSGRTLMTCLIDALMKCGDVPSDDACFNQTKSKNLKMYGAMMKGL